MKITDIKNPWRAKYQHAWFRGASFFVETDTRAGGRRVALHQYPKRNVPYAEDMGRTANAFQIQGYLIGPNYLDDKDILIAALEKDGPGALHLPLPYQMGDVTVMVQGYSITESREKGGYCAIDMTFVEYGDPSYRANVSTTGQVEQSAQKVETSVMGTPTPTTTQEIKSYSDVFKAANVPNIFPGLNTGGGFTQ